jgi:hypothetical protein
MCMRVLQDVVLSDISWRITYTGVSHRTSTHHTPDPASSFHPSPPHTSSSLHILLAIPRPPASSGRDHVDLDQFL